MLDFECILENGISSKDLLMSLIIETCYRSAPSLYCEMYQESDGSGKLCWRYSLQYNNRIIQLIKHFGDSYNIPEDKGIEDVFSDPHFVKEYQKINPAQSIRIPAEKMHVVYKIIHDGLPKNVQYPHGLDGHEYYLTTYGTTKQEYSAWVAIPNEWGTFAELMEILIEAGNWNRCYKCQK